MNSKNVFTNGAENAAEGGTATDPALWVDEHADALYRFALLRVNDPQVAEDLVQDTFVSALRAVDRYRGQASVRTWLIGILKHKVVDHFRKDKREITASDLGHESEESGQEYFDEKGRWKDPPRAWDVTPESLLEDKEFRHAFTNCLDDLSPSFRDAFTMKEIDGMKGEEICKVLGITATNLWVILHRSRTKLRKCLEVTWFESGE